MTVDQKLLPIFKFHETINVDKRLFESVDPQAILNSNKYLHIVDMFD